MPTNMTRHFLIISEQLGLASRTDGSHPFTPPARSFHQNKNQNRKQNSERRIPLPLRRVQLDRHRLLRIRKRHDQRRPLQVQLPERAPVIAAPGNCKTA